MKFLSRIVIAISLAVAGATCLAPRNALAGPNQDAVFMIHLLPVTTKNECARGPPHDPPAMRS